MNLVESNLATQEHINAVRHRMINLAKALLDRAMIHDASKLAEPEASAFAEVTDKLRTSTYGSKEYEAFRLQLGPALAHHYANNSHHPEHYPNGIDGMSVLDICEMICDWGASCKRHNDGNLFNSITKNRDRFAMSDQLTNILKNSIPLVEKS